MCGTLKSLSLRTGPHRCFWGVMSLPGTLAHTLLDYKSKLLELKTTKAQQIHEIVTSACLAWRDSNRKTRFRKGTLAYSPQHIWIKCGRQGGSQQKSVPVFHCFWEILQEFVCQVLDLSHLPMNHLPLPPWSKMTSAPHFVSLSLEFSCLREFPVLTYSNLIFSC